MPAKRRQAASRNNLATRTAKISREGRQVVNLSHILEKKLVLLAHSLSPPSFRICGSEDPHLHSLRRILSPRARADIPHLTHPGPVHQVGWAHPQGLDGNYIESTRVTSASAHQYSVTSKVNQFNSQLGSALRGIGKRSNSFYCPKSMSI